MHAHACDLSFVCVYCSVAQAPEEQGVSGPGLHACMIKKKCLKHVNHPIDCMVFVNFLYKGLLAQ